MEKSEFFNKELIYNSLRKKLMEVMEFFLEDMDNMIRTIDFKNAEYIKSTINRIKYISNKSQNIEGQINTILKYLISMVQSNIYNENQKDAEILNNFFNIYTVDYIDDKSFYTPHAKKSEFVPNRVIINSDTNYEERMKDLIDRFAKRLNKSKAYESGQEYLKNKDFVLGSEINIKLEEDYLKFINLLIYAQAPDMEYNIEMLENTVEKDESRFKEFIIRRK